MPGVVHSRLYYYLYRFYDPNLQRWLNQDPINELGFYRLRRIKGRARESLTSGFNNYCFVVNDPVDGTDFLGLYGNPIPPCVPYPSCDQGNGGATQALRDCIAKCVNSMTCPSFGSLGVLGKLGLQKWPVLGKGGGPVGTILAAPSVWNAGINVGCALGCAGVDLYNDVTNGSLYPVQGNQPTY